MLEPLRRKVTDMLGKRTISKLIYYPVTKFEYNIFKKSNIFSQKFISLYL